MVVTLTRPSELESGTKQVPESELAYALVREDPALEMTLVEVLARELGRPLRVAVVASGGCTALTLLSSEHVASVDAIDLNPAQLHLVELKRTAISCLSLEEQRALFGTDDERDDERWALYRRVRDLLPDATRAHWDERESEVRCGVSRVARFERLCRELADAFVEEGLDPARRPSEALGHPSWRHIFGRVFDGHRLASQLGTASVAYSTERSMSAHFSQRMAEALRRTSAESNYLLANVLSTASNEPPWMQPELQAQVRRLGVERLRLHRGTLLGVLKELAADGPAFDLVQTSDVTDWLPRPERSALVRAVRDALVPGGALLARRLNSDGHLAPVVRAYLEIDGAMSAAFLDRERSFLYREVVVARRAMSLDA